MTKSYYYYLIGLSFLGLVYWRRQDVVKAGSEIMATLSRKQFIDKYGPQAQIATAGTVLFPSVMLAQAILESNNGNSTLSREAFNFFGIKANSTWLNAGKPYVTKQTTEYVNNEPVVIVDKFRKYASPAESFKDRNNFLLSNTRYTKAGVFSAKTPEAQAKALQTAGYATDPNYSNLLITLINSNNLKRFDV